MKYTVLDTPIHHPTITPLIALTLLVHALSAAPLPLFYCHPRLVTLLRLERRTYCLEGSCSIQLSYGAIANGFETGAVPPPSLAVSVVGTPRFELGISCSQSRRDNRTSLYPEAIKKDAVRGVFLAEKGGFEPPVP